jgi:hypothetical protein
MSVYSFCGFVVRAFSHSSNYLSTSYGPKIEKKIHLQKITQLKKKGQTTQWAKEKGQKEQTTIYKTLHRKQKIEQHEPGDKS